LSYGEVACRRQGEIMRSLTTTPQQDRPDADEIADALFKRLQESGVDMRGK